MPKVKLIVHIGSGKTGSSSIQAVLEVGRTALLHHGAKYLGIMLEHAENEQRKPWQVRTGSDKFFYGCDALKANLQLYDVLKGALEAAEAQRIDTLIWSNEWLFEHAAHAAPTLMRLAIEGYEVKVQCYVRAHDGWARSAYVQWGIKDRQEYGVIRPFSSWLKGRTGGTSLRFYDALRPWADHFHDNLRIFNYDTKPDVVAHFLAVNCLPSLPSIKENVAPSLAETEMWALYNHRAFDGAPPAEFEQTLLAVRAMPDSYIELFELDRLLPSTYDLEQLRAECDPDRQSINLLLERCNEPQLQFRINHRARGMASERDILREFKKYFIVSQDRLSVISGPIMDGLAQVVALKQSHPTSIEAAGRIERLFAEALTAGTAVGGRIAQNLAVIVSGLRLADISRAAEALDLENDAVSRLDAGSVTNDHAPDWLRPEDKSGRIAAMIDRLNSENRHLLSRSECAEHEVALLRDRNGNLMGHVAKLQRDLVRARLRPWREVQKKLEYQLFSALSRKSSPVTSRMRSRYAKMAMKRDPRRTSAVSGEVAQDTATLAPVVPIPQYFTGGLKLDRSKPNILIVSHEASRTGAPILALNLMQAWRDKYNIFALTLRGGEILDDLIGASVVTYLGNGLHSDPFQYTDLVRRICNNHEFEFAVVNSVVSRPVLFTLRQERVPSVILIHEFATNIAPKSSFREALSWADQVVFSSELTMENAFGTVPLSSQPLVHVVPQGKCAVPKDDGDDVSRELELRRLDREFGPRGKPNFVVLGAGMVEFRKGVDLFIEVARLVAGTTGGEHVRFLWVGGNYDPDIDFSYSVYLKDQIDRAGVSGSMKIVRPTSEIDHAYALSNVLFLSSRLDPLPNVAIDALSRGLPVVCFEKANGVADFLRFGGLENECVAGYLDCQDAANKIVRLAHDQGLAASVSRTSEEIARKFFDFDRYAARIEALAHAAAARLRNRASDIEEIMASGSFRPDFYCSRHLTFHSESAMVENFVRSLTSAEGARKPEPGFNPLLFAELCEIQDHDPYAEFIRRGRPAGPWMMPVIELAPNATLGPEEASGMATAANDCALHIHAYFTDGLSDLVDRLHMNRNLPDLFVSVADEVGRAAAEQALSGYKGRVCELQVVSNRGRDIGPFLTDFGPKLVEGYEFIGHIHVKRSPHVEDALVVDDWMRFLYENVVGGSFGGAAVDQILAAMRKDHTVGIVYPDDPQIVGWTLNLSPARQIAARLGIRELNIGISFPVGTMFWMRQAVLRRFVEVGYSYDDYPSEPIPIDGTMLHALERLFGVVPLHDGWTCLVTNVRGLSR